MPAVSTDVRCTTAVSTEVCCTTAVSTGPLSSSSEY